MYYTLVHKKDRNCPIFIDGVIHPVFFKGCYDAPMDGKWYDAGPNDTLDALPTDLVLVTRDQDYEFDFCMAFSGFIVSDQFLLAIDEYHNGDWEVAKLDIVNPDGKIVSDKPYFFLRQKVDSQASTSVIDFSRSQIEFRDSGEIKSFNDLVLIDSVNSALFCINEITLSGHLFISEALFERLFPLNLKGIQFISLTE